MKSSVRRIHKVKTGTNIKETYSDEALELMRDNCTELRDLAMIDMLASTGMRVGEMVLLNREDIDFNERECVVFGKGDKERVVYFDARTKIHLQNYLQSRMDNNPALFVSLKAPYERLKIGGIEVRLRNFGKKLGLSKVHPHKFRRTLATMAIDKGMPIEQLRHKFLTVIYCILPLPNLKLFLGFNPVRTASIAFSILEHTQENGISIFNCSFQTILPPDERYGFSLSSGKSN